MSWIVSLCSIRCLFTANFWENSAAGNRSGAFALLARFLQTTKVCAVILLHVATNP